MSDYNTQAEVIYLFSLSDKSEDEDFVKNFVSCFKQKTAYEMRESDWSSDVCSSDLVFVCVLAPLDKVKIIFRDLIGKACGTDSVSYTHLDVYKRQQLFRSNWNIKIGYASSAILYLSEILLWDFRLFDFSN